MNFPFMRYISPVIGQRTFYIDIKSIERFKKEDGIFQG